jgi:hypothetical protein
LGHNCGFTTIVTSDGLIYEITVTSDEDNETAALSHIELCFCDGPTVSLEEEEVTDTIDLPRESPNDEPGVEPVEIEIEDPEED